VIKKLTPLKILMHMHKFYEAGVPRVNLIAVI